MCSFACGTLSSGRRLPVWPEWVAPMIQAPTSSTCFTSVRSPPPMSCAPLWVSTFCSICGHSSARTSTRSAIGRGWWSLAAGSRLSSVSASPLWHMRRMMATRDVVAPLVGTPSYINDLLAISNPEVLAAPVPSDRVPVLQALLRHALLREYTEAAARALDPNAPGLLRDAEFVDLVPTSTPTPTWSWLRAQPVAGGVVRDVLVSDPVLADFRAALKILATTPAPALERHLAMTLDAASHRLDAWVTSVASRRLAEMRTATPNGIGVGGYGWVEYL